MKTKLNKGWRLAAALALIASVPVLGARSVSAEGEAGEAATESVVTEPTVAEAPADTTAAPVEETTAPAPAEETVETTTVEVVETTVPEVIEEETTVPVATEPVVEAPVSTQTAAPVEEAEAPAPAVANAAPAPMVVARNQHPKKVFVCKYVGKPGADERLQTGQNPISVSVNAIPNFNGVGSYFADAQGRSYVLAFDEGQPKPSKSECPGPDTRKWTEPEYPSFNPLPCVEYKLEKATSTWTVANGWSAWIDWPDAGPLDWGVVPNPRTGHHGGTHGKDGDRHFAYVVVDQRPITTGDCAPKTEITVNATATPGTCLAKGAIMLTPENGGNVSWTLTGPDSAKVASAASNDPQVVITGQAVFGPFDIRQVSHLDPSCLPKFGEPSVVCAAVTIQYVNNSRWDRWPDWTYTGETHVGTDYGTGLVYHSQKVAAGTTGTINVTFPEDFNGGSTTVIFRDRLGAERQIDAASVEVVVPTDCEPNNPCPENFFEGYEERGGLWEVTYGQQHTDTNGVAVFTNDSFGGLVSFNGGPVPDYMGEPGSGYQWLYVYGDQPGRVWTWDFADGTRVTATASYTEEGCPVIDWQYGDTPAPAGSFVSFCGEILLLNDGNVNLTFKLGENGEPINVPAGQSESVWIADFGNGVLVTAHYGDQLVFEGTAQEPDPCKQPSATFTGSTDCADLASGIGTVNRDGLDGDISVQVNGQFITVADDDTFVIEGFEQPLDIQVTIGDMPVETEITLIGPPPGSCSTTVPPDTTVPPPTTQPEPPDTTVVPPTTEPPTTVTPPTPPAPTTTPTAPPVNPGELPKTGGSTGILPFAVGMLALGALAVLSTRRRRFG